jgi:hypothetical protein
MRLINHQKLLKMAESKELYKRINYWKILGWIYIIEGIYFFLSRSLSGLNIAVAGILSGINILIGFGLIKKSRVTLYLVMLIVFLSIPDLVMKIKSIPINSLILPIIALVIQAILLFLCFLSRDKNLDKIKK